MNGYTHTPHEQALRTCASADASDLAPRGRGRARGTPRESRPPARAGQLLLSQRCAARRRSLARRGACATRVTCVTYSCACVAWRRRNRCHCSCVRALARVPGVACVRAFGACVVNTRKIHAVFFLFTRYRNCRGVFDVLGAAQQKSKIARGAQIVKNVSY